MKKTTREKNLQELFARADAELRVKLAFGRSVISGCQIDEFVLGLAQQP
jgi:hypothetical protein